MLKSNLKIAFVALSIPILILSQAEANNKGKLPKDAVALSVEEVKAIFAGKTFTYSPVPTIYFSPDGTLSGFENYKGQEHIMDGTWTASGNESCRTMNIHGSDKSKNMQIVECRKFYKVGKVVYDEYTKGWPELMGNVNKDYDKLGKAGDAASIQVDALHKKFGY